MTGAKPHELILAAIRAAGMEGITESEIRREAGLKRHFRVTAYLYSADPVYESDPNGKSPIRYYWAGQALRKK